MSASAFKEHLLSIFTDDRNSVRNHDTQIPRIQIWRSPECSSGFRVAEQEVKVITHLWDETLTMHQFDETAAVITR